MCNSQNKPKLSSEALIQRLRDEKGIRFVIVDENQAIEYFKNRNNYLRTASYRKNYQKHDKGPQKGQYINLDFAYLKELSTIDMYLRRYLLNMTIDLEHALKVKLVQKIEQDPVEDGYSIIKDFLALEENLSIRHNLEQKSNNVFTGDLIAKYFTLEKEINTTSHSRLRITDIDCPIWVFVELITFGEFIALYDFYAERSVASIQKDSDFRLSRKILSPIKSLRNACAHNNCLLTDLSHKATTKPPVEIARFIQQIPSIGKGARKNKLSSRPLLEMVCLLYYYQKFVSEDLRKCGMHNLKSFTDGRMMQHSDYFYGPTGRNSLIASSFDFISNVVDFLSESSSI